MRFSYFILILLLISSCAQEVKDRLQGHWVCVENCDEIKTLDFYGDSVEINSYLKYLRLKENSYFKYSLDKSKLIGENTFFNEHHKIEFPFEIKNEKLIVGYDESIFIKKAKNFNLECKLFLPFDSLKFNFPVLKLKLNQRANHLRHFPELFIFNYYKGKPVLHYQNQIIRVESIHHTLLDDSHYSEEGGYRKEFYIAIEADMKMKDVDSIFKKFSENYIFEINLLYKRSNIQKELPESWIKIYLSRLYITNKFISDKKNLFDGIKFDNEKIKNYLTYLDEETEIRITLKNDSIFINSEKCKNHKDFVFKIEQILSLENRNSNLVQIDSVFIYDFDKFLSNFNSKDLEYYLESIQRDNLDRLKILKYIPKFKTKNYQHILIIESDSSTTYEEWLQIYSTIQSIYDKTRQKICKDIFHKDYSKLNKDKSEDFEILKMVRGILPIRLVPLITIE